MLTYYPPIAPYAEHKLPVEAPHVIYAEECGNPKGLPVLFVHGGPGSGCGPDHRRFFDPEVYRIILFDQRGCGQSTPHAELQNNSTQASLSDIEALREHLGINQWILFGGSWGATLSLVYAQAHPDRVLGLILRGIFLARKQDIQWLTTQGANQVFPDYWEQFMAPIPQEERHDLLRAYYHRLTGHDEVARMAAAKAWATWEGRCASVKTTKALIDHMTDPLFALALARLECHFMAHGCFLEPNQILRNMSRIQHIPAIIVHGRYDMVCPIQQAWELHRAWPISVMNIVPDAGHLSSEPGITSALIQATRQMGGVSH